MRATPGRPRWLSEVAVSLWTTLVRVEESAGHQKPGALGFIRHDDRRLPGLGAQGQLDPPRQPGHPPAPREHPGFSWFHATWCYRKANQMLF